MDDLKIVYLSPDDLTPYENNTRKHSPEDIEGIKKSILDVGFDDPIGIWGDQNIIVEGHGRQIAAKELHLDRVPCIRLDHLTDTQRREYAIRHNRSAEMSAWDFGKLEEELAQLSIDGIDMDDLNFVFDEIMNDTTDSIDEDEAPSVQETVISKRGQIYQLGNHRVMCGDATSIEDISKLMNGTKADVAITSPPYGESKSAKLRDHYVKGSKQRKSLYNEHNDDANDWMELIEKSITSMRTASHGQFINIQMLADNKRDLIKIIGNHSNHLCDIIIWDKQKAPPQMQDNILNNEFEFVFVFGEENASRSIPFANFHGNTNNIIRLSAGINEFADVHRAVYPVAFPASILKIASKANTILDVFGGTGTTMIACEQMGKTCFTMEIDPKYVDVIIKRWENMTGRKAVLIYEPGE